MANENGSKGEIVGVPRGNAGQIERTGFGTREVAQQTETAGTALAARSRAQIEARYVMAMQRPRDLMVSRQKLLASAQRPGFAKTAIYHKPVGKGVEGPSIRFAEEAVRALGNIHTDNVIAYEDDRKRIVTVQAIDLESNIGYDSSITVEKSVERRELKRGQQPIAQRVNSFGDPVFIVPATDDEILNKQNALVSKALRTLILRLLPSDLLEEAMAQCRETMLNKDAEDPAAAKKEMCDAFATIGISAQQLADYMGHGIAETTPDEFQKMRGLFGALRDGEATWAEAVEAEQARRKQSTQEGFAGPAPEKKDDKGSGPAAKGKPTNLSDIAAKAKTEREAKSGKAPMRGEPMPGEPIDLPLGRTPGEEG